MRVEQQNPADNSDADLYTPGAGKEAVVSTLSVCNAGNVDSSFRIAVRKGGASITKASAIVHESTLAAGESKFFTIGMVVSELDVITVRAATSDVGFSAFINETDI